MVHRTKRLERGAAAVEMALVLPVLVLFIGGIIDFGRAYYTQIMLANAAREGARGAVVLTDPQLRASAQQADVPGWLAPVVYNRTLVTDPWSVNSLGCNVTPTPVQVKVTTKATFSYTILGFLPGITSPTTISSSAVMGCK